MPRVMVLDQAEGGTAGTARPQRAHQVTCHNPDLSGTNTWSQRERGQRRKRGSGIETKLDFALIAAPWILALRESQARIVQVFLYQSLARGWSQRYP